jgi:hypothetical protein
MPETVMDDLRYPIGQYMWPSSLAREERERCIDEVTSAPAALRAAVAGLSEAQLDTPYRPEGWTVRQVVHHVPDSHVQALVRFKLALTEDEPTIKAYHEDRWARLPDYAGPVAVSLDLLDATHARWVALMRGMREEEWGRTYFHPEHGRALRLDAVLGMYAWHGAHHTAHITRLRDRDGWD